MSNWSRNDVMLLGRMAMQAGLADVDAAYDALEIGARWKAHGLTHYDLERAIMKALLDG